MSVSLGRLVEINPATPEFDRVPGDEQITFLPLEACWPDGRVDLSRRASRGSVAVGYTRFRRGDVLMPKITPTFEAGRVFAVDSPTPVGAGTTELHVLRPRANVEPRFIAYLCRSLAFLQEGHKSLEGVGNLRRVPVDFLRLFPVAVVDGEDQRRIADYLDRETTQIDALIGKQERLIETLRERRTALVGHAINGLPDRRRLKYQAEVTLGKMLDGGKTPPADAVDLPYVRAANIKKSGEVEIDGLNRMPFTAAEARHLDLRSGDVLVVEGGAMGRPAYLSKDLPDVSFQKTVNRVRPKRGRADGRFLYYALMLLDQAGHHRAHIDAVSMPHLTAEKLAVVDLPWAPLDVQRQLARDADAKSAAIDVLVDKAEHFIALARERRSALITAAVTGQINVWTAA